MYSKDEKVLCFHQELLYDAKILEVRLKDPSDKKSPHEYLVHYKGWKNTYVLFFHCLASPRIPSHSTFIHLIHLITAHSQVSATYTRST